MSETYEFAKAFRFVVESEAVDGTLVLRCWYKANPRKVDRVTFEQEWGAGWIASCVAAGDLVRVSTRASKVETQESLGF